MDRTILYREIVRIANESLAEDRSIGSYSGSMRPVLETTKIESDFFTKEANQIASELSRFTANIRLLRPRYLSLSGSSQMTDAERDSFDAVMRKVLQRERNRVQALEQWEKKRREVEAKVSENFAYRWFSGIDENGAAETLSAHHNGMIFYLNLELQHASQVFAEIQSVRLARGSQSSRENITIIPASSFGALPPADEDNLQFNLASVDSGMLDDLLEDQPQAQEMIQEEHNVLLEELNATLDKAQKAEQSLREIAELQSELSEHLKSQSSQLDSLTTDAFRTSTHVESANTQLQRAHKTSRRTSRMIIYGSISVGVFLLILNGR